MNYDFRIFAGDSGTEKNEVGLEFVVKDKTTLLPIPLGDDVIEFTAWRLGAIALTKRSDDAEITVDVDLGKVLIPFSPVETQTLLPAGAPDPIQYTYKVVRTRTADSFVRTVLRGNFTVHGGA